MAFQDQNNVVSELQVKQMIGDLYIRNQSLHAQLIAVIDENEQLRKIIEEGAVKQNDPAKGPDEK